MNGLNSAKLQELMEKGIVTSVYRTSGRGEDRKDEKLSAEQAGQISLDAINTISIQQGYNYSKLMPMNIIIVVNNHIEGAHYSITIPAEHLKEALEILNWDMSFGAGKTAQLFNMLQMSSTDMERPGRFDHDLKSRVVLSKTEDYRNPDTSWFTIHSTDIDSKKRFKTLDEVYDATKQNYARNVLTKDDPIM